MTTTGGLTFTTTKWVVHWVHSHTTSLWADTLPAVTTGLTDLDELVLRVTDDTERGAAVDWHTAHFRRGKTQRGKATVLRHELDAHTSTAGHLATTTGAQLNVVHGGTSGDETHGQGVAVTDVRLGARLDDVADLEAVGSEDVALLTVGVVQQRNTAGTVRVVLNCGNLGGHAVLVALEVDDAVLLLVTTTAVA